MPDINPVDEAEIRIKVVELVQKEAKNYMWFFIPIAIVSVIGFASVGILNFVQIQSFIKEVSSEREKFIKLSTTEIENIKNISEEQKQKVISTGDSSKTEIENKKESFSTQIDEKGKEILKGQEALLERSKNEVKENQTLYKSSIQEILSDSNLTEIVNKSNDVSKTINKIKESIGTYSSKVKEIDTDITNLSSRLSSFHQHLGDIKDFDARYQKVKELLSSKIGRGNDAKNENYLDIGGIRIRWGKVISSEEKKTVDFYQNGFSSSDIYVVMTLEDNQVFGKRLKTKGGKASDREINGDETIYIENFNSDGFQFSIYDDLGRIAGIKCHYIVIGKTP